jgi:hypothetical protein
MTRWMAGNDPVLQRYGVGAIARTAVSGGAGLLSVASADGLRSLAAALECSDPQAQCYAAAAVGALLICPSAGFMLPACLPSTRPHVIVELDTNAQSMCGKLFL